MSNIRAKILDIFKTNNICINRSNGGGFKFIKNAKGEYNMALIEIDCWDKHKLIDEQEYVKARIGESIKALYKLEEGWLFWG